MSTDLDTRLRAYGDTLDRAAELDLALRRPSPATELDEVAVVVTVGSPRARRGMRAVALAAVLVSTVAVGATVTSRLSREHLRVTPAAQPGAWHEASPPPLDLTAQVRTVALSDGRLLVVAGSFDVDSEVHPFETAVYDASADHWTRLGTAPVAPRAGGAELIAAPGGALLVTHADAGDVSLALLSTRTLQWRAVAIPPSAGRVFDAWAWDGTTLALAHFGDSPYGSRLGSPAVERWNADTNTWSPGAAPPVAPRSIATVARTPNRLAVWGGFTFDGNAAGSVPEPVTHGTPTTAGTGGDPPRHAFTDGAIYDVASDTWTYLPAEASLQSLALRGPAAAVLTDSTFTIVSSQVEGAPRVAARYEHGGWHALPSPAGAGGIFVQQDTGTIAIADANESGPRSAEYIDGTATQWHPAPAYQLVAGTHGLLAISSTMDNPGNVVLSVWQLDGSGWTQAAPAPFTNLMEPGVGVVGDRLVVIGGQAGPNLEPAHDAWVLDLPY